MGYLHYFSENFDAARAQFRHRAQGAAQSQPSQSTVFETWTVPSPTSPDLTVDSIYFPRLGTAASPAKRTLIVMLSGVHGLEGYAGSAIQAMFLDQVLSKVNRSSTGILLVHAMNPYGFRFHRRGTENHVNLNRNCSIHPDFFNYKNPESLRLGRLLIPETPVDSFESRAMQSYHLKEGRGYLGEVSLDEFVKAVGIGQFSSVQGLEYGGAAPEPQTKELIQCLQRLIPDYDDILLFDLHTGLGHRGRLHILTGDVENSVDSALFEELFSPGADQDLYDFTSADSEGFYKTLGATNNLFPEIATRSQRVCALTMEFGTLGHDHTSQLNSLNLWLLEHQGLFWGFTSTELENKIKTQYLEKFYPQDPLWKETVVATSHHLFERILVRLENQGK